MVLTRWNHFN